MELHKTLSEGGQRRSNLPFSISIYTKEEPIYHYFTAYGLRDYLNIQFKLGPFMDKNIECTQIKYTLEKNETIIKLGQTLKSSPLIIDNSFNKIDGSEFAKEIFKACDCIEAKDTLENNEELNSAKEIKGKLEEEACNKLQTGLKKLMTIYNTNQSPQLIKSNTVLLSEVEKSREEIKITGFLNIYDHDYQNVINCHSFDYSTNTFSKKSRFFIKTNKQAKKGKQGKETSSLGGWKIGFIHNGTFIPYFDTDALQQILEPINGSIKVKNGIMREPLPAIKRFQVYSQLFDGLLVKFEIRKVHLSHVYVRKEEDEWAYYIQMDYPPKFFGTILDTKLSQETGYINTWKRVQNYTLVDHDVIKNNELLRLHLFNNVVVRLAVKKKINDKSREFLEGLYQQMSPKCSAVNFTDNSLKLKNILHEVNYEKFTKQLFSFSGQKNEVEDLKWNLKYLILCLLSRGLLSAFEVQQLVHFVQDKKRYKTFIYIFDKMCDSDGIKGIQYIKKRFQEFQQLSEDLLDIDYSEDCIAVRVWRIQITPTGYLYCNKAPEMKSRMQREYAQNINHFMRASVVDDDGNEIKNQVYLSKKVFRELISGFKVIDRNYIPLGWSPSQLRSFSLWFLHSYQNSETRLLRSQVLNFLGKFEDITPPAKMAARIGQAFSSSWAVEKLGTINVQQIPDIEVFNEKIHRSLLFTDGIGKISRDLIEKINLKLKLHEELGAIQVRYLGVKGVLAVAQDLPKRTIQIRPSMKKYQCLNQQAKKYLDILDWNKYKAGFLNRQIIILLRSRGVQNEVFMDLQNDYIRDIQQLTYKECSIFKELVSDEHNQNLFNLDPASKTILSLMESGFDLDKQPFFRGVMQILKRNGYEKLKEKSNINVKKSARLMGIIDEFGVLGENTVYCKVVNPFEDKQNKQKTVAGNVILVRNPCLHTADIRKVRAVSQEEVIGYFGTEDHPFKSYPNTVIMSQKGQTPITSAISGSDLDGDNFWICWDEHLICISDQEPFVHQDEKPKIPAKPKKSTVDDEDYKQMLDFFCDYMNYDLLGKIANSHLIKADRNLKKYAYDQKCIQLAIAHGHAVDFPKSGYCPPIDQKLLMVKQYPDFMEKQDEQSYPSQSILGILYRDVKRNIQAPIIEDNLSKDITLERLDQDLISVRANLDYSKGEIKETLQTIYMFVEDIERIKFLANLDNQFQIYTGNVTSKTKGKPKKNKGFKHGKLMQQIVLLKQKYQKKFFNKVQGGQKYLEKYREVEDVKKLGDIFSDEIKEKAALWYALSYVEYFREKLVEHSKDKDKETLRAFRAAIVQVKKCSNLGQKQVKQLGLVWFIIPKVLMELKITATKLRREVQKIAPVVVNEQPSQIVDASMYQTQIDDSKYEESQLREEEPS